MPNNYGGVPVVYQTAVDILTAEDVKDTDFGPRMIMVDPELDDHDIIGIILPSGKPATPFVWECRNGNVLAKEIVSASSTVDLTKIRLHL